jgi:hypothetical protein
VQRKEQFGGVISVEVVVLQNEIKQSAISTKKQ